MPRSFLKLGFVIMPVTLFPAMGFADILDVAGSTAGAFNDADSPLTARYLNLTFTGVDSFGGAIPDGGVLENVKLGSFAVTRSQTTLDYDATFGLSISLTDPANANGGDPKEITANVGGTIKRNGQNDHPLYIQFSASPTPISFGPGGSHMFFLTLDNIQGLGTAQQGNDDGPWEANLTGNFRGPAVSSAPEPAAIVLFGSMVAGLCILRKRTRKQIE